jgi:hypothetical protein
MKQEKRIHINNVATILTATEQLDALIDTALLQAYNEIWINGHGETSLTVLINPEYAFFMYMRYEGDNGLHSANPNGARNAYELFILTNAQQDEYPQSWLYDREKIKPVLKAYFELGERYEGIEWLDGN